MQQLPLTTPTVAPVVDGKGPAVGRLADFTGLKAAARSFAASQPPRLRMAAAQAFCAEAVAAYWSHLPSAPRTPPRMPPAPEFDLGTEGVTVAVMLGTAAARMSVEHAAYIIGSTYAAMLPDDHRAKHGVFYTPPAIVERLLDAASEAGVDWLKCRVLDPACGGGAFLGPVARRMAAALRGCDRRVVLRSLGTRLRGFELDAFAAWISLVFLDVTLHDTLGYSDDELDPVIVCNSLEQPAEPDFDLVIGNPPYGRITLNSTERERFRRSLYGHANLYGLFLDLALRHARDSAVVAYVAPTSFLCGEYHKRLRALLAAEAPPVQLDFLTQRAGVFDDVLQETLLAVFRRGGKRGSLSVNFVDVEGDTARISSGAKAPLPFRPEEPWIIPRSPTTKGLAGRLRELPHRLADWGYGVSTGPLVWNRFKDRMRQRPASGTVPLIWAEAVSADGKFAFRAARRNHAPYFATRDGDDALLVKRPCVLLQRTTSKEQARRLIAAELPSSFIEEHGAVTVENHLNMVLPIVDEPPVETEALAAFLNSRAADRAFRCISGTVAVSAYELEALPLPSPDHLRRLSKLLQKPHTQSDVESLCDEFYGDT